MSRKGFLAFCVAITCMILIGFMTVGLLACYEWASNNYITVAVLIIAILLIAGATDLFYQLILVEDASQRFKISFFATIHYDRTLLFNLSTLLLSLLFLGTGINASYSYVNKQVNCLFEAKASVKKADDSVKAANNRVKQVNALYEDLMRRNSELEADNKALYKTAKSKLSAGGPQNF
jgi:uncharacterized membrane protein